MILKLTIIFLLNIIIKSITLENNCSLTPFWKLNLCQINCDTCLTGICSSCPYNFTLTNKQCVANSDTTFNIVLLQQVSFNQSSISSLQFSTSSLILSSSSLLHICSPNSFKFDMLGLFPQSSYISYSTSFSQSITSLQVKFYFFTCYENTKVVVVMNGAKIYSTTLKASNIDCSNKEKSTTNGVMYLEVPALTQANANTLIHQIDTGQLVLTSDQQKIDYKFQIEITYLGKPLDKTLFWAFSDFSITASKCDNCISQILHNLSVNVGIAIGIMAGALVFLIAILFACVKYQQRSRLLSFQNKYQNQTTKSQSQLIFVTSKSLQQGEEVRNTKFIEQKVSKNLFSKLYKPSKKKSI